MTERTDRISILAWRLATLLAATLLMTQLAGTASAWVSAHGDRDNSGFVNVTTAPAGKGGTQSVPGLGTFRPGAGPVVAPDGTVYIGTTQGKLIALRPDGSQLWSREITRGQAIVASPAIGSDGSIYVIGVQRFRDNRVNPPKESVVSTLHRFNSTGAWLAQILFPDHGGMGPAAIAPPNIWRSGNVEAIMVPTLYANAPNTRPMVRLIAFTPDGQVLDDVIMLGFASDITGGSGLSWGQAFCLIPPIALGCELRADFTPPDMDNLVDVPPIPGVAIMTGGGSPLILASDHHNDLITYSFTNQRFKEVRRVRHEDFVMRTPPTILPSGLGVIGMQKAGPPKQAFTGRLVLARMDGNRTGRIDGGLPPLHAAATRLPDGGFVVVDARGGIRIVKGSQVVTSFGAVGRSMASAAVSRNHLFVAAENGFTTYDVGTFAEVSRIDWIGGGLHPPVIGPQGHVYAIASNVLFVFPPPKLKGTKVTTVGQPTGAAQPTTSVPSAKTYNPPLTSSGNRLFACEELDEDDCGKGDHTEISLAWCQKQGYAKVQDYDVDKRKVKAETLDGRFCSRNTCRVFDSIGCEM